MYEGKNDKSMTEGWEKENEETRVKERCRSMIEGIGKDERMMKE